MKKLFVLITSLIVALLLCGCTEKAEFAAGKISVDQTELSIVLQEGETEKLELFTELKSADFRGSENYEEICAWSLDHPEVSVLWTVPLPDGQVIESAAEKIDLSETERGNYVEIAELTKYLPALKEIDFDKKLKPEDLAVFVSVSPEITYLCDIDLGEKTISSQVEKLELIGLDDDTASRLCLVLPILHELEFVDLGDEETSPELSWKAISELQKAAPETDFSYSFSLYKLPFNTLDTEMDLSYIPIYDEGELVREALSIMPRLTYLDMDSCKVHDESMAAIRDDFPDIKVVWRIWFGSNYTVRTDVEKILASKPSVGGALTTRNTEALKYCTELKYLDIGHNDYLESIDFVSYMPKLEVFIVAMAAIDDISPLANCTNMEFLEIQTTQISDISALSGMKDLKHLNICYLFELTDISPVYDLDLERLWIGRLSPVPTEQVEKFKELHPDCEVNTTTYDPHEEGWRYVWDKETLTGGFHPRYATLVEQFGYDSADYAFPWKDPKYR